MANEAPTEFNYRVFHLPLDDPNKLLYYAGKFSTLHLSALQKSAGSFGSTFARESAWNIDQWVARLTRPSMHTFIAVAYAVDLPSEQQTLETGDWIGCGTLIGPTPYEIYHVPASGGPQLGPDSEEDKWHMTFVYNEPSHRRKGVSKRLILASCEYTDKIANQQGKKSWMRVYMHPSAVAARSLYTSCGFKEAGDCSWHEAAHGNGDADLLPEDHDSENNREKYHSRIGLGLMRRSDGADFGLDGVSK